MPKLNLLTVGLFVLFAAKTGQANVKVDFVESAPKDRFVITNTSECELSNFKLEIDLANSAGKLYFDTTGSGAGVEVFQPFESDGSNLKLVSASNVNDGDQRLSVLINNLPSSGTVTFTIDVDDALVNSSLGQIRVTAGEFEGAEVRLSTESLENIVAVFTNDNSANVMLPACK